MRDVFSCVNSTECLTDRQALRSVPQCGEMEAHLLSPLGHTALSRHTKVNRSILFLYQQQQREHFHTQPASPSTGEKDWPNPPLQVYKLKRESLEENLQACDATAASCDAMLVRVSGEAFGLHLSSYFFMDDEVHLWVVHCAVWSVGIWEWLEMIPIGWTDHFSSLGVFLYLLFVFVFLNTWITLFPNGSLFFFKVFFHSNKCRQSLHLI